MTTFLNVARQRGSALINEGIVDQALTSVDTYVDGSILPFTNIDARTSFRWRLWLSKTGAGVAAPLFKLRVGTAGAIADTQRVLFTGPAQTAVADAAYVEIIGMVRSVGASAAGVISGVLRLQHNLDSTGFAVVGTPTVIVTSAGFDTTVSKSYIGLSIDPGAAAVWTVSGIISELVVT